MTDSTYAPELLVQTWFNTDRPLFLSILRGRVVVLAAFQVLCPNSIAGTVPQAQRIYETFEPKDVAVIGLHATSNITMPSARQCSKPSSMNIA